MSLVFNTLEYTKGAEKVGIKREHAEYQAKELFKLIDNNLVTNSKLETEIKSIEVNLIKWMIGISLGQTGIILSLLGFMLKH